MSTCQRDSQLGIEVIVEGSGADIDIVVVNGLQEARRKTWTNEKDEATWLARDLKDDLVKPRILCWGLAGDPAEGGQKASCLTDIECLKLHAMALVNDLCDKRRFSSTMGRPIIFLAHGLGGLLVQSALLQSESFHEVGDDSHGLYSIRRSTVGVVFLDTPHHDNFDVPFKTMLENLASLHPDSKSDGLTPPPTVDAKAIDDHLEPFNSSTSGDVNVVRIFSEGIEPNEKSSSPTGEVVPPPSTSPKKADEKPLRVPDSHSGMAKLACGQRGETYQIVLKALKIEGLLSTAIARWQQTLKEEEARWGPEHTLTLTTMHTLANLYGNDKRPKEAGPLYEKAYQGMRKINGPDHLSTILVAYDLGVYYKEHKRSDEAEDLYERCSAVLQKMFGIEHPFTASVMHSLGVVLEEKGQFRAAEDVYRQSLRGKEAVYGWDRTASLNTLFNMALIQTNVGEYQHAEHNLRRTIQGFTKDQGPEATSTLRAWEAMGTNYVQQKRYNDAERVIRQTLETYDRTKGPDFSAAASCCANLSIVYMQLGILHEAEAMGDRAYASHVKRLGAEHMNTLVCLMQLGCVYIHQRRFRKAKTTLKQVKKSSDKTLGPQHLLGAKALRNMAFLYDTKGKKRKVKKYLGEAEFIEAAARAKGPVPPKRFVAHKEKTRWSVSMPWNRGGTTSGGVSLEYNVGTNLP